MVIKLKLTLNDIDKEKLCNTIKEFNELHKLLFSEYKDKGLKFKNFNVIYPVNYNIVSIKGVNKVSILTLAGRVLCEFKFIEYVEGAVNKLESIDDEFYLFLNC